MDTDKIRRVTVRLTPATYAGALTLAAKMVRWSWQSPQISRLIRKLLEEAIAADRAKADEAIATTKPKGKRKVRK